MKVDFTLGDLWQIEDAIDYYIRHRFGGTNDPQLKLYIKFLKELHVKVVGLIDSSEDDSGESSSLEIRMDDLARQIADLNVLMQDFSRRLKVIENQID